MSGGAGSVRTFMWVDPDPAAEPGYDDRRSKEKFGYAEWIQFPLP